MRTNASLQSWILPSGVETKRLHALVVEERSETLFRCFGFRDVLDHVDRSGPRLVSPVMAEVETTDSRQNTVFFSAAINVGAIRASPSSWWPPRAIFLRTGAVVPPLRAGVAAEPAARYWPAGSGNRDRGPGCSLGMESKVLAHSLRECTSCCNNLRFSTASPVVWRPL